MRITEAQVARAEERAEVAEESRRVAASELQASPYSDVCAMKHSEASQEAAKQGANARELRAAYEKQLAEERVRLSRPVLEKAAAAEIDAAGVELAEREREVVEALERAQGSLAGLLVAGEAFNAAVRCHAEVLVGKGLDVRGGELGGVRTVLSRYVVKVHGRRYEQLDAGALGAWLVHRVVEARIGRFHHLVSLLQWVARAVGQDAAAVVARVPEPGRVAQPALPRVVNALQALRGSK
ncbi:hypothetical protein [Streptomyces sp. NPDC126514]|uniref:hypothetical protein n=1 Tax=Streptomyces sp. NPDC126514 TaxID=3155210 RepID=UPI00332B40DA